MDDLVVDSSVVMKWLVTEAFSKEARRILTEYYAKKIRLLAPDILHAEIGNIVWKKHRFQGVDLADAKLMLDSFYKLVFTITPSESLLTDAFDLAVAHQRTVYDSMYLALRKTQKCEFVTADKKLFNAVNSVIPEVIWVEDWQP